MKNLTREIDNSLRPNSAGWDNLFGIPTPFIFLNQSKTELARGFERVQWLRDSGFLNAKILLA